MTATMFQCIKSLPAVGTSVRIQHHGASYPSSLPLFSVFSLLNKRHNVKKINKSHPHDASIIGELPLPICCCNAVAVMQLASFSAAGGPFLTNITAALYSTKTEPSWESCHMTHKTQNSLKSKLFIACIRFTLTTLTVQTAGSNLLLASKNVGFLENT